VLADYVLGKVSAADLSGIASHVAACSACQSYLETLDGLTDSVVACLRGSIPEEVAADASLLNELLAKVESIRSESNSASHDLSHDAVVPQQIGQYRLLEKLGRGSMGVVYKAFHTKLKRPVAVKLLPSYSQRSPNAVIRFHREMEAVGRLDHPNIVRAHDAGESDGQFFLVMEFVDGANMSSLVRSGGPLEVAEACDVVRQAAIGLQHAHDHGLIHRDVKPSNLMLATSGVVKVLDLGLARLQAEAWSDGEATASGQIIGSPDYMAPEQGSDPRGADARADVYALGCTLYFLLAGRPPFGSKEYDTLLQKVMAHANEEAVPIEQLRPDVCPQVVAILDKMLAKNPADRCSTADVIQSLSPFCVVSDLARLFTNRSPVPPAIQTAANFSWLTLNERQPKLLKASVSRAAVPTRRVWLIGLCLIVSVTVVLWLAITFFPTQPADTAQPSQQKPTATKPAKVTGNASSSPVQTPAPKPDSPLTANLRYSMDLDRWQVGYFRPKVLTLSEFPIDKRWVEPPAGRAKRLYGILRFGDATKLNLIVDLSDQEKSAVRVAFDQDVRFDDKPARLLRATAFGGIEFAISYPNGGSQPYAIRMYYSFEVSRLIGGHGLHYYRACLREGAIVVDGKEYAIAILDDGTRGDYSDLENTNLMIGADANSKIQDRRMISAGAAFKLGDNFYTVSQITPDGSRITIKKAQRGEVRGIILDQRAQKGIHGAMVLFSPVGLSATTDSDGRFCLQLPEGEYSLVTIRAEGYVPRHLEDKFAIAEGKPINISGQLQPAPSTRRGRVRLRDGDSYHFLAQRMFEHQYQGGDFYVGGSPDGPKFWANNLYQGGLVEVGNTENKPLERVIPPPAGYNRFGVLASAGHTYVSLAKEGEEGHYVIFRVVALGDDSSVEIEYYYR
jgi:serine/threonine protein kinase